MGTFQKVYELLGTVGAKFALLGGLYFIFIGIFLPVFGRKFLKSKSLSPLKIAVSCLAFGGAFVAIAGILCFGFNDGFPAFVSIFEEILSILMVGAALFALACMALYAYWEIHVGKTNEDNKPNEEDENIA